MHKFKFFEGLDKNTFVLSARWEREAITDIRHYHNIDAVDELTNLLSQQISEEIDNEIVGELTRRVNGGHNNNNADYLNFWLRVGDERA
jgi:hypothetical protein